MANAKKKSTVESNSQGNPSQKCRRYWQTRHSITSIIRLNKCFVGSKWLYGDKTWTISKILQPHLEAFKMWTLRRMLRINCTRRAANEEVLWFAGTSRSLLDTARIRKFFWAHHETRVSIWSKAWWRANEEEGDQDCSWLTTSSNGLVSPSWTPSEPLKTGEDGDQRQETSFDTPRGKVLLAELGTGIHWT